MRIVSLGEVLWDVFPDETRFGGAPANFACHAASHGAEVTMISRVGVDMLGDQALMELESHKVIVAQIQRDADLPTGTVLVKLNEKGVPSYTIGEPAAWDRLAWTSKMDELASDVDAVYYGTLGQRDDCSHQTIQKFVSATPDKAWRIYDVNLRSPYCDGRIILESLCLANVLKLSDEELDFVADLMGIEGDMTSKLKAILEQQQLRLIALTRGSQGAILIAENEISDFAGFATTVKDTVGAGDSFTATLVAGLLRGESLETINRKACQVAAYVCSQKGATPPLPVNLSW